MSHVFNEFLNGIGTAVAGFSHLGGTKIILLLCLLLSLATAAGLATDALRHGIAVSRELTYPNGPPMKRYTPSAKEALILRLLSKHGELFGLQMVASSNGALKRDLIYHMLARLEGKGLVEYRAEELPPETAGMIPRRLYKLTVLGRQTVARPKSTRPVTAQAEAACDPQQVQNG